MMTGTLRVQSFAARFSAPVPDVVRNDHERRRRGTEALRLFHRQRRHCRGRLSSHRTRELSLNEGQRTTPPQRVEPDRRKKRLSDRDSGGGIQVFACEVALVELEMLPLQRLGAPPPARDSFDGSAPLALPARGSLEPGPRAALHAPHPGGPIIPENVTVHLGRPTSSAQNVTVSFRQYIANVASSEVYPTWPEQALRANIHAQISLALNRVYTEWYCRATTSPSPIPPALTSTMCTSATSFEVMQRITDDIFNTYVRRTGTIDPYYTEYCDGKTVSCKGMKQWGTVDRANAGMNALQILRYYYGNNIEIVRTTNIQSIPKSYPGTPLRGGSTGKYVRHHPAAAHPHRQKLPVLQQPRRGRRVRRRHRTGGQGLQKQFNLAQDGVVGRSTWYKISYIYTSVKKLAQLTSEGEKPTGSQDTITGSNYPGTPLRRGSTGNSVQQLQFWLQQLSKFDPSCLTSRWTACSAAAPRPR